MSASDPSLSSDSINFSRIENPCVHCDVYRIAWSGDSLLASTSHGLMKSSDSGATWRPVSGPLGSRTVKAICTDRDRSNVAYAFSFGSIYVTQDAGESWTERSSPSDMSLPVKDMVVSPGRPDRLVVLTYTQGLFAIDLN
jgi:hypothetical protein